MTYRRKEIAAVKAPTYNTSISTDDKWGFSALERRKAASSKGNSKCIMDEKGCIVIIPYGSYASIKIHRSKCFT